MYIERDDEAYWLIGPVDKEVVKLHKTTHYYAPPSGAFEAGLMLHIGVIPLASLIVGGIVRSICDSSLIGWGIVVISTLLSWLTFGYAILRELQQQQRWADKQQHPRFNYWDDRLSAVSLAINKCQLSLSLEDVSSGLEKEIVDQYMNEVLPLQLFLDQQGPRSLWRPYYEEEVRMKQAAELAAQEIVQLKLALSQ